MVFHGCFIAFHGLVTDCGAGRPCRARLRPAPLVLRAVRRSAPHTSLAAGIYDCGEMPSAIFCMRPCLIGFPVTWSANVVLWRDKKNALHPHNPWHIIGDVRPYQMLVDIDWHRAVPLMHNFKHPQVFLCTPDPLNWQ